MVLQLKSIDLLRKSLKKIPVIKKIIDLKSALIRNRLKSNLVKNGREILVQSVGILESINVNYWLDYGTLLGAIRNKGFIKGDGDIDLGIDIKEDIDRIIKSFKDNGFKLYCYYHVSDESLGRIVSLKKKGIILDLYNYTISENEMSCTIYEQEGCESNDEYYRIHNTLKVYYLLFDFEIETVDYSLFDINVKIPKNYEEYLTTIYGSDYMVEKSSWTGSLNKKLVPEYRAKIR